jgi:hypothetical protein
MPTDDDDDLEGLLDCIDCGTTVAPERDRAFSITDEVVLCYECSVRRGGVYDSDRDQWAIAPSLEEIPEEKRPSP